jgi:NAD(P)-dependent dehydrogenase (short-subunit alcohol dehydrogenase family)
MSIDDGLAGKVATITGAARDGGIGRATARHLARQGVRLIISDIGHSLDSAPEYKVATAGELAEAAQELEKLGAEVVAVHCDVTKPDEVDALVQTAVSTFGRLDIMVANAGVSTQNVMLTDLSSEQFDQTVAVNLKGTFLCMRAALRQMLTQGEGGRVINVSSQAAKTGWPLLGAYCASKFGVTGLTQVGAKEVGGAGITVNAVCPGTLDNPLNDIPGGLWDAYSKLQNVTRQEVRDATLAAIPLGRFQTPEDVADLIVFLASDQGGYITGQSINTTGGQEMH